MAVHDDVAYQVVAARRLQWDNLVWQVPVLSLTAQAFLFTIALGGDSTRAARVISSVLSLVVSALCMSLMARHRQSEIMDAHLLADHEAQKWGIKPTLHGADFAELRGRGDVDGGWAEHLIVLRSRGQKTARGFRSWIGGLFVFVLAAFAVLFLTAFYPKVLDRPVEPPPPPPTPTVTVPAPQITFAPTIVLPTPPTTPASPSTPTR